MTGKSKKLSGAGAAEPASVEVVIETDPAFSLQDPQDVKDLMAEIEEAIRTDLAAAFTSSGTLRVRGSKRNC